MLNDIVVAAMVSGPTKLPPVLRGGAPVRHGGTGPALSPRWAGSEDVCHDSRRLSVKRHTPAARRCANADVTGSTVHRPWP